MDSWPMIKACKEAQWRGFSAEDQSYMTTESERGRPVFIALGHHSYELWTVEHVVENQPNVPQPVDYLISVKIDCWPGEL